jgi:sterol desaturase/sphingolipid hydroxylase (fatty acid hydroxylase superfamily)
MRQLFLDQFRLLALVTTCAALWTFESMMPLYAVQKHRLRRALPNIGLTGLLVLTNLALSFAIAAAATFVTQRRWGLLFLLPLPPWATILMGVAALDLSSYCAHLLLHKFSIGWRFHRVHHTDNEVNVTTAFRQHPVETVWRILWYLPAIIVFGIPLWVFVIYRLLSTLNAQLEHANIRVLEPVDRLVRVFFVTPNMHKVHHSREQFQTDSNYANILSLWDRLFGTYTASVDFRRLRYGLDGFDDRRQQTFTALLRLPFLRRV